MQPLVALSFVWAILPYSVARLGPTHPLGGPTHLQQTEQPPPQGAIAFASVGRPHFCFDVYAAKIVHGHRRHHSIDPSSVHRVTDGVSVNFNAQAHGRGVAFVSERDGGMDLYVVERRKDGSPRPIARGHGLDDHVTFGPDGDTFVFVSTREPAHKPQVAWTALYEGSIKKGPDYARRISPKGLPAYSPTLSPDGRYVAYAGGSGRTGHSAIYLLHMPTATNQMLAKDGGWPAFSSDGKYVFYHRNYNGQWGIWRVRTDGKQPPTRLTGQLVEAVTPSVARDRPLLAMAVIRPGCPHRSIALMDLSTLKTAYGPCPSSPQYNPSLSADGSTVYFHTCRQSIGGAKADVVPNMERLSLPNDLSNLTLVRTEGHFPAFSPDGEQIALNGNSFQSVDVMDSDGSHRHTVYKGDSFYCSWGQDSQIRTSGGPVFANESTPVDLLSIPLSEGNPPAPPNEPPQAASVFSCPQTGNNAFPTVVHHAQFHGRPLKVVFRSGRDGHKNLYVHCGGACDRTVRLTKGQWTDTMPNISPDASTIVFSSDRLVKGRFDLWLLTNVTNVCERHVRGEEIEDFPARLLLESGGSDGRTNHPWFSPDGQWIVFTSDYAGYSAEEVSVPHQYQPYGEIFIIRPDGTGLRRLTHNAIEDGTPAWGFDKIPPEISAEGVPAKCDFQDYEFRVFDDESFGGIDEENTERGDGYKRGCPYMHKMKFDRVFE